MIELTLSVQTTNPDTVARATEVFARAAAGLALEVGQVDVNISIAQLPEIDEDISDTP